MDALARRLELKRKINGGEPTVGLFIKIASAHVVEMLGSVGIDFVVLDAEHAPFSIDTINNCIMAGRCAGVEVLVRVSSLRSTEIQAVLDMGAAGVVVPHITCADDALSSISTGSALPDNQILSSASVSKCPAVSTINWVIDL